MPTYIRLIKLTEQGVKNVKNVANLVAQARKEIEASGGKLVASYSTLGRYDFVAIVEFPDDRTAMKVSALIGAQGNVKAETLPAVPADDFSKLVH